MKYLSLLIDFIIHDLKHKYKYIRIYDILIYVASPAYEYYTYKYCFTQAIVEANRDITDGESSENDVSRGR